MLVAEARAAEAKVCVPAARELRIDDRLAPATVGVAAVARELKTDDTAGSIAAD